MSSFRTFNRLMPRGLLGLSTLMAVLTLTACSTTATREQAMQDALAVTPAAWTNSLPAAAPSPTPARWWGAVGDARLKQLVEQALSQNLSLAVAARRVDQARVQLAQVDAQRWPQAQGQLSATSSKPVEGGDVTHRAQASVSVSWELDLWRKLAAQTEASDWSAQATEQDRLALQQSLVASVVRAYWQWSYAAERVNVAQANLALARKTADLTSVQYKAGAVSGLGLAQTRQALAAQEASVSQWRASLEESRQALALLLGVPPQAVNLPAQGALPSGLPPSVTPGLPAEVLACRPDVRASQARLQQTWAQEDATARQWYPAITLTGSVSGSSVALSDVLKDPLAAVSTALTMPFLQWRERQRNVALAEADADIARLQFHATLFTALSEVDKALVLQRELREQVRAQDIRLTESRTIERLTRARYDAGAEPLRVWLDAQQDLRQSELDHAQVVLDAWTQWANTMLALGQGGC